MIISVNKPHGITSRDAVNIICNKLNTRKVGHTGTLDPIATGVLIICTDEDTKLVEMLTSQTKEYIATIKLGVKTDTLDISGNILETKDVSINKEDIRKTLSSFLGKSRQEVPIYSAVKVKGKKLYEYARNNISVELPTKEIEIFNIELIDYKKNLITFKTLVSKGTYIRSLIRDICERLNVIGTMNSLIRTKQGIFNIEDSITLEDIEKDNYQTISKKEILKEWPFEKVTENNKYQILNGAVIPKTFETKYLVFTNELEEIIAIYQEYEKDKTMAKPYKMFCIK